MSLLDTHGTKLNQLQPVNIIQAAEEDMRRKARNGSFGFEHYAFHRSHVRKSGFAVELIAVAQRDCERGRSSGKRWTRLIYSDPTLLQAALAQARAVAV